MKRYKPVIALVLVCNAALAEVKSQPLFTMTPTTTTRIQVPFRGLRLVNYIVTNQTNTQQTLAYVPASGVTQTVGVGQCSAPFTLAAHASCLLSLQVDAKASSQTPKQIMPQVCATSGPGDATPSRFRCSQPSALNSIHLVRLESAFPYGAAPKGDVCVSSDYYATPETMLGSWAMIQAVASDVQDNVLPSLLTTSNVVYAVGTAAIGAQLGLSNCDGGCNQLNGYCFALKFNDKTNYPYMIFQSVNIGANPNSFDIYMAGGGSGAFPASCAQFWGTGSSINWGANIQNAASCASYFNNYSTINASYSVTYNTVAHPAKETLMSACTFSSAAQTGFNTTNWSNVTVVPVTCPQSLTQITGVDLPSTITTVGNQAIHDLSTLSSNDFAQSTVTGVTTTQMQDCKTPSSGYCGNVAVAVPNYQASISADLTKPLLTGQTPSGSYCAQNPTVTGYCSWSNGQTSGGTYCNQSQGICYSCGNSPTWCTCSGGQLISCVGASG